MNISSKITTARITVNTGTLSEAPQINKILLPNPIIKNISVFWSAVSAHVAASLASGWRIKQAGLLLIPSMESIDLVTNSPFIGFPYLAGTISYEEIFQKVSGPPYELSIETYNISASVIYGYFSFQSIPEIELPPAPIVADQKEK